MTGLSIHVVDVARGVVATGMRVDVLCLIGDRAQPLASGKVDGRGTLPESALAQRLETGVYEVVFHVGEYLANRGDSSSFKFLDIVPFRFSVASSDAHYHLPFKFTAWGFSCFRGGE